MNFSVVFATFWMYMLALPGHAQQPEATPVVQATSVASKPGRGERLEQLRPDTPLAYFELAEEFAADPISIDDKDLARRLYVTAALITADPRFKASITRSPSWLASSACLGLASLAESDRERRWLVALAGTLAPEEARGAFKRSTDRAMVDTAAQDLAAALDALRAGFGQRAAKLLDRPGASALLDKYERLLTTDGRPGGAARVRGLITRFQVCKECRNERVVRDKEGVRLCPTCGGRPGPKLEGEELVGQLRLESLLVSGIQRSWAAQTIADEGAPLRELDLQSLADTYTVDGSRVWYREGRWVSDPSVPPASPTAVPDVPSGP